MGGVQARAIPQRARDEATLSRLAAIVENTPDAILVIDLGGTVTDWNHGAEQLYGYSAEEMIGRSVAIVLPEEAGDELDKILTTVRRGHVIGPYDAVRLRKNVSRVHVSLTASPITDVQGRVTGISWIARDITECRAAEDALREADRRKTEFLAMLSHELRNPMAAISAALQLMGMPGLDDGRLRRARDAAERQARHMARLLDELLDVARITRGNVALRTDEVTLDDIVSTAVDTARPAIEAKGHVLSVSLPSKPLRLHADPTRLAQVVANLLDNAAKYTPDCGHILVSAERVGDEAVLRVRDDGMGVAAALLPHVFDLFAQGERSLERREGGLGIGLTMVRRLVEMHGGRVEARSDGPGKGSEFVVRLPLLPAEARQPTGAEQGIRSGPRARVLVVDDVDDMADVLAMAVEMEGHSAQIARNGPAALELAATYRPDVVLLDLGMPGMDGYEVARRLRKQDGGERITIIAVTGYGRDDDRERSRAAGIDHHLVKPVDVNVLWRLLLQETPSTTAR